MIPQAKSLADHVHDRTFRARRHHELLAGSVLPWPPLAAIQSRYVAAEHKLERRAIAVEFERAVRTRDDDKLSGALAEHTSRATCTGTASP